MNKINPVKIKKFDDLRNDSLSNYKLEKVKTLTTLDFIFDGGIEQGSIVQILGESNTGKTLLLLQIAKNMVMNSKNVVYIDTDGKVNLNMEIGKYLAESNHFIYKRCNTFDEVEKFLDELIDTKQLDIIIIDSLPGLINKGYVEGNNRISVNDFGSYHNSKPLCMFLNKYRALVNKYNLILLFSNQYRSDIKVNYSTSLKPYGPKNLLSSCDIVLSLKKIITITKEKKSTKKKSDHIFSSYGGAGILCNLEIEKNNNNKPCSFITKICYKNGMDTGFNILSALLDTKIIEVNGTYYSLVLETDIIKGNGVNNFLEECEGKINHIYKVYEKHIIQYYSNID